MATTYSRSEVAVSDVRAAAGVNDAMLAAGRVLIAILFVMSGLEKVMDIPGTAAAIGGKGLPMPSALAIATVVVELGGGLLIIVGWQTRMVALALALFAVPAAAGYRLMRDRPELAQELIPEEMLRRAAAGRGRVAEGRKYVEIARAERPAAASFIIVNNVRVAFACFAGGIFLGLGALVALAYNGLALGTFAGHFANQGLLAYLLEFVVGHGVLELSAIWIAGAAGFLLGRSIIAPGTLSRADALVVSGRVAVRMVGATAVLLVIAGLIEGFISAGGYGVGVRLTASAVSLALLAGYLASGLRFRAASSASGSPGPRSPAGSSPSRGRAPAR